MTRGQAGRLPIKGKCKLYLEGTTNEYLTTLQHLCKDQDLTDVTESVRLSFHLFVDRIHQTINISRKR